MERRAARHVSHPSPEDAWDRRGMMIASGIHPLFGLVGVLAGVLLGYALGMHASGSWERASPFSARTAEGLRRASQPGEVGHVLRESRAAALAHPLAAQPDLDAPPTVDALPAVDELPAVPRDDMKRVITASTGWGTAVTKSGMLPTELWHREQSYWEAGLHQWLSDRLIGGGDEMRQPAATDLPPQAHMCIVRICPAYRLIFIRSSKTGTSSVFASLGGPCGGPVSIKLQGHPACFWLGDKVAEAGPRHLGFDSWEQMWANYTVFTIVRNPFDRAGSGYDYVDSRRSERRLQVSGRGRPVGCEMPSFARFLRQPWVLGLQDTLFECVDHREELRTHDWYHIEPQSQCLFDHRENIVLDYILRLEHLEEDMPPLIEKINANRMPGVPVMEVELVSKNRGKLVEAVAGSAEDEAAAEAARKLRHLKKYEDCGTRCFLLAQQYFANDLRLLKFPTLPLNSTR